jgi:hypothetical protein
VLLGGLVVACVPASAVSARVVLAVSPSPFAVSTGAIREPQVEGSATFTGTVDPSGEQVTSCLFEYATEAEYGATETYGKSEACEQAPGSGGAPIEVSAKVAVVPGTVYHYRLTAANANGSAEPGEDRTFFASERPQIQETSVTDVSGNSATLHAQIDPERSSTTYQFQYGPSEFYGVSIPMPGEDIGAGVAPVSVTVHVQGLSAATVYHYRVVASNSVQSATGPDHTFTTQPAGGEFILPDGREYELVSPADKHGSQVWGVDQFFASGIAQAAETGDAFTYITTEPPLSNATSNGGSSQIYSTRSSTGWSSQDISTPRNDGSADNGTTSNESVVRGEYDVFSSDLSLGFLEPPTADPLTGGVSSEWKTPYLRDNIDGDFQPLVTSSEAPQGEGPASEAALGELATVSPTLSSIVYEAKAALTSNAVAVGVDNSGGEEGNLYDYSGGRLQLVNVLPDGDVTAGEAKIGNLRSGKGIEHAISNDGSRIFWSWGKALYERDINTGETVQVDGGNVGEFATASGDGSKVFFLGYSSGEFFVYENNAPGGKLAGSGSLTDLTPGEAALGVLGASEDGTYVYYVSNARDLYVMHYDGSSWTRTFIAKLSPEDRASFSRFQALDEKTARVSPNGRYLTFMSAQDLVGYDNRDAVTGSPDVEVYLYDAKTGRLTCPSCNPTGARPTAINIEATKPFMDPTTAWRGQGLAAMIPTWSEYALNKAVYQPRFLSDEGRLFFDSVEGLVAQDTNGVPDVYEYEPDGVGSCRGEGGCVFLISSGVGPRPSLFMDASASGSDVFFLTADRLVSQDYDNVFDVYDAHVCTTAVPCLPAAAASPPPCDTGDSCKAPPTPQPPIFGSPASATFSGPGNQIPPAATPAVKPKTKAKAKPRRKHRVKHRRRGKVKIRKSSVVGGRR